ncbi:MAG TPA: hypothetical protein VGR76_16410 [Candidatus Angelobacter sp.]|nr:hypothetical protein [Candidatus Angelobacter sp.]
MTTTMKTIPLSGVALEKAKELAKLYDETGKTLMGMDRQVMELRKLAHQQMLLTIQAIKEAMGLPPEAHLHVDATYLNEHGIAFGQLFEHPPEDDENPFAEFLKSSSAPPTVN